MPEADDEVSMHRLRRAAVVVLVAGLLACAGQAGSGPADPTPLDPGETQGPVTSAPVEGATPTTQDGDGIVPDHVEAPDPAGVPATAVPATGTTRTPLPGFGEVAVEVRRVDGEVLEWCLLLAETPAQTQRGLMEVTDP